MLAGKESELVGELVAGDIGAATKLGNTATGDTLAPKGKPVRVPAIAKPEPVLAVAIASKLQGEEDKLANALRRLQAEDSSLIVERSDETKQTLLRGMGETHLTITLEKLSRKFGVEVATEDVRVPYRETITRSARAEGRYKKQTGGHGQFGLPFWRSSHCRAARASNSSTRSREGPSRASSFPQSRRASPKQWSTEVSTGSPWSMFGCVASTASTTPWIRRR